MSKTDSLIALIQQLHPAQVDLFFEIVSAMLRDVKEEFNPLSDLASIPFRLNFRDRLLIHHATNEAKLSKKAFEYAFGAACAADGKKARITSSQTNPGTDVTVDGVGFSLKTEAAAGMRADSINISKLSEGRWIQQCTSLLDLVQATVTRIPHHLLGYERILVLRALSSSQTQVIYELVEIPRSLLLKIENLTIADFTALTRQGGSTAKILSDGKPAFTLRLDGSNGKVTIVNLQMSLCTLHCRWTIPTLAPSTGDA